MSHFRHVYRVTNKFIGTRPYVHSAKRRADLGIPKSPRGNRTNETQKTDEKHMPCSSTLPIELQMWPDFTEAQTQVRPTRCFLFNAM